MGTRLWHRKPDEPNVTLASVFEVQAGDKRHVVNFPYLTAALASMQEQRRRDLWTTWLAVTALVVAVGAAMAAWVPIWK